MRRRMRKWWLLGIMLAVLLGAAFWAGLLYSRGVSFRYSNLVDNVSQQQARSLLAQAKVPEDDTDAFFALVDEFYRVPYEGLVASGWKKTTVRKASYDEGAAFAHFDESNCSILCRQAAFLLTRYGITFGDTSLPPAAEKDQSSQFLPEPLEQQHYNRLFSNLPADGAVTSEEIWEVLNGYWKEANVDFRGDAAQLVGVYGLTGDKIQNLHAAVALYGEDGVWLLEKYDPLYPFQFSHFEREQDMVTYLKRRAAEVDCAVIVRGGECLWAKK